MQIQNAIITGSFSYNGADLSNVTSSNAYSASLSSRTTDLESTSSVLVGASSSFSSILSSVSSSQQQLSSSFLTLTASFNAVSASQQQISSSQQQLSSSILTLTASYTALSSSYTSLSASYNTFSGSASTRITVDSASLLQVSASQQQISASYIALSGSYNMFSGSASTRVTQIETVYATTGSNSFRATQSITGSLTVTGQIIAQTLNVQQVTSSIIYSSGSNNFGCDLNSRQTFTGSVLITGSLTIAGASSATSYSGTTIFGSTAVCSPVGKFTSCIDITSAATTGTALRINGDNLTTGTALSIVSNDGSASHTGNLVEICNAFNAGAAAKLMCLYQGDDGDGIYINMARGGVGLTVDGAGGGYSAIFNNGNVGIGTSSPQHKLDIQNGNLGIYYNTNVGGCASGAQIYLGDSNFQGGEYACSAPGIGAVYAPSTLVAGDLAFFTYTGIAACRTERMRIVGGNVGIGTCTPTDKLHILGADNGITICAATANRPVLSFINGSCTMLKLSANATYGAIADNAGSDIMFFKNGNIGIGAVSCAWAAPTAGKVIQLGNRAAIFSYNNQTLDLSTNLYFDGGDYRYIQSAYATLLRASSADGTFVFYNAASGTAGCVVSLNERIQITSGGSTCFYGTVLSTAPSNGYNFRGLGFSTGAIATGGSCLIYSSLDRGLYLISIASSVTSTYGYSAFLWVDSGNITVSSVIRQACVGITTSGRALCVVNQYGSETAIMTVTTLNLLNYIG